MVWNEKLNIRDVETTRSICQQNTHARYNTDDRFQSLVTVTNVRIVSLVIRASALLFFRLTRRRRAGLSRQPRLAVGGCRLSGGGWRRCWPSRQRSPNGVEYAAEEDGADETLEEQERVVDADEQIEQAEEDEHADDAEIQMMMWNVEQIFVFQDEQDWRDEARLRRPATHSRSLMEAGGGSSRP